jgi:hypothetical protein
MDLFFAITSLFHDLLINGLFISILFIICVGRISKKIDIQQPLNILRWIIITQAILGIIGLQITFFTKEVAYLNRATGPYWWAFLLMLVCSSLLPFILLHKKLSHNKTLLLVISIAINIGWLFERFVIVVTSLHRDYAPSSYSSEFTFPPFLLYLLLEGIIVGVVALIAGNIITRNNLTPILSKN